MEVTSNRAPRLLDTILTYWEGEAMDEGFEYQGHWWTPEELDEKIPSILRFDPEEGVTLSLFGSLRAPEGEEGIPVLGLSVDNTPITATQTTPAGKAQDN